MKTQSAKNKGRLLQKKVVALILEAFPQLKPDDVSSRSMGAGGEDILLSPLARSVFPFSVECKSMARSSVYKYFDQAKANCPENITPLVVLKANRQQPLVILDLSDFIEMTK